jgi:polyhydroxyalkanoate synthesis regulator phasin
MPENAVAGREIRIEGGEPGEMKLMMPRMLRHLRQSDEGDGNVERRVIIRKSIDADEEDDSADLSEVREEIDALRKEMKELREQLKR